MTRVTVLPARLVFGFVFLCMAFLASIALADGAAKRLKVGYEEFIPYSFTDVHGVAQGIGIDTLRLLLEPQGYLLEFVPKQNPSGVMAALQAGEIDLTSLLGLNEERARIGAYSSQVSEFRISLFFSQAWNKPLEFDTLQGLRIGTTRGSWPEFLLQSEHGVTTNRFSSGDELVLHLLRGDVDAIATSSAALTYQMSLADIGHHVQEGPVLKSVPNAFLVRPDRVALLSDLNRAIGQAQTSGAITGVRQNWLASPPATTTLWWALMLGLAVLLGAGVFLAVLGRWRQMRRSHHLFQAVEEALDEAGIAVMLGDSSSKIEYFNRAFSRV